MNLYNLCGKKKHKAEFSFYLFKKETNLAFTKE